MGGGGVHHFSKVTNMVLGFELKQMSVLFVSTCNHVINVTVWVIGSGKGLGNRCNTFNCTNLGIQEGGSHICQFQCTQSSLFRQGCIDYCKGILWYLHTLGALQNSTSSCHWSRYQVDHMLQLGSHTNTSQTIEPFYQSPKTLPLQIVPLMK